MHGSSHPILMTMVAAIAAGVLLIAVARRAKMPSIVLLLAGGVALGPDGFGVVQPHLLGDGLRVLVSLLVGVILFEGGLTLDLEGYRQAPRIIVRLLTIGMLTTWLGIAAAVWLLGGLPLPLALVSASLLIVTGPTVVGPLLKRIRVTEKVHHVLQWEGVLIDPIGVFIAILALELFALGKGSLAFVGLGLRIVSGLALGLVGGVVLHQSLKRRILPHDMAGVGSLATAVLLFGVSELVAPETGLLSVTVAGFYVGWRRPAGLPSIKSFKQEITELAIGMLFILLSARLDLHQFLDFGWAGIGIVAVVMFIVRPASIFVSTVGLDVPLKERALLSWIAPRGIVAATMASLLALELERLGSPNPRFVETLTYAVIVATIVVQGFSAGIVAKALGLVRVQPPGWLVVGANRFARDLARLLEERGIRPVLLVDTNRRLVRQANAEGLAAVVADAREPDPILKRKEMSRVGQLLALTPNEDLNTIVCRNWIASLGDDHCYRWQSIPAVSSQPGEGIAIWSALPSPSALSTELEGGDARLAFGAAGDEPRHGLMTITEGQARLDDAILRQETWGEERLVLARRLDELGASLREALAFEIDGEDRQQLVETALERIGEVFPHLPLGAIREDIAEQERTLPASLGDGVAVPHATVASLGTPLCALIKPKRPLDWDAPDDQAVDIVLILLSPAEDPDLHLSLLASVARKLSAPAVREALRERPVTEWAAVLRASTGAPKRTSGPAAAA